MTESATSVLTPWANFYVMTGSAAAALTGLMFVVITLVTGAERSRRTPEGISTFSTPTVVHFAAALLVSAILNAPWTSLVAAATLLGLAALCGVAYVLRTTHRTTRLTKYRPDVEDWTCYTILPLLGYGAILAGAIVLRAAAAKALFGVAGGVALLIFVGIHNAWDIVTFIVVADTDESPNSS